MTETTAARRWDTADDMLEAAMGLISAAGDWKPAGIRWEGDTPIPLPPSDSPDSVEWRAIARQWLDAYAAHLSELLAQVHDVDCPTHGRRRFDLNGPEPMCAECRVVGSDRKPLGWADGRSTEGGDDAPSPAPDSPAVAVARTEARLRRLAGDATAADALDGLLTELAALPEWSCPACGATTRARMADHTPPTEGNSL